MERERAPRGAPGLRANKRRPSLFRPLDWLLVRAPLLPVEAYLALNRGGSNARGEHDPWGHEPDSLAPRDGRVGTALAVGGGDLLAALERTSPEGEEAPRLRGKLLRYQIRMSTRPTPYGLFAGVGLGEWGPVTDLSLSRESPPTRTRPDMDWLLGFVQALEARPELRRALRFVANSNAWVHAGRVFLGERALTGKEQQAAVPVSIRATAAVRQVLALARRPVPHERLVAALLSVPGATAEKAEDLMTRLWQQTLLYSDLRPPLTVASPARYVADRLRQIPAAREELQRLEAVLAATASWDSGPWEGGASGYRKLVAVAGSSLQETAGPTPLQVDMALPLEGRRLSEAVADEATRAAELLLRLTPSPAGPSYLEGYRRAFEARYGMDREAPLLEMLDPNFGLGAPSAHGHGGSMAGVSPERSMLRQQTLRDIAIAALRNRTPVVELEEETISRLETWSPSPSAAQAPVSLDLAVFVLAASPSAIDRGEFQLVVGPNLGASAAGRNLGRFADVLGPEGDAALRRTAELEAAHPPERYWAEIVYLPRRGRSANVAVRPSVRGHEIAIGTMPGVPADRVIPLDELVVGVRGGRFYVRWPAAGVEVVPCAGHMLNTWQAPDVVRFLDDVARDGVAQISSFDWGPAWDFPFLPRVQMGRIILSPAHWRIDDRVRKSELRPDPLEGFDDDLRAWRTRWQVPRYVYLSVGDNRLLLDLDDPAHSDQLRSEVERMPDGGQILLQEALPAPDQVWMPGPEGRYVTELVVPMVLAPAATREGEGIPAPAVVAAPPIAALEESRLRPPGTEWLFAKVYCPTSFEEDLIAGPMRSLCEYVDSVGLADQWFFIRYTDPDPHLRLRFQGDPDRLIRELLPELCSWAGDLMAEGTCLRFSLDTYDREVERYGGTGGTAAAETLFAADSRAVIELLSLAADRSIELDRTTLAVMSIDDLLAGLGLGGPQRLEWYRERATSRRETGQEYRQRQKTLRRLLGDPDQLRAERGGDALSKLFAARRAAIASVGSRLDELEARGELVQPKTKLLRSFVHLHCNRLTGSDWSVEERALGLLVRTQESLEKAPVGRSGSAPGEVRG